METKRSPQHWIVKFWDPDDNDESIQYREFYSHSDLMSNLNEIPSEYAYQVFQMVNKSDL